jgi:hypothetical protein
MKKLVIMAAAVFATVNIFAQGTVNFSNIGISAPVFNTKTGANAISGTSFTVALYFAPSTGAAGEAPPDDSTMVQLGASASLVAAGTYNAGTRTADIAPPGFFGWFQVRAWETSFGSYDSAANQLGLVGKTAVTKIDTGDPTTVPPGTPASLKGISGIQLAVVPEPSVIGLGLLGAGALFLLRRRK